MLKTLKVLCSYYKSRRLSFKNRTELERYQAKRLTAFLKWVVTHSPYFKNIREASLATAADVTLRLADLPLMDKEVMMENFDGMNTAGLKLETILSAARLAESTRDFQTKVEGYTVGLSSGTSATRGAFIVSETEKAKWAGVVLSKMLPDGLFAGERVALFLRADSGLYQAVESPWITFRFFDLASEFRKKAAELAEYSPTILVAPAQVLRQLALDTLQGSLKLSPKKVISVAEVLEPQDRLVIERAFGKVHQVYQATEGFLASTCEMGTLHLNEEYLHIEPEWLDVEKRRFVPIITDFTRKTQPIVRYRLNDVLVASKRACPCGRVTRAIDAIEGRCDDLLLLSGKDGRPVPVFADALSRAFARFLPLNSDYRLTQIAPETLKLQAEVSNSALDTLRQNIQGALQDMGVETANLKWELSKDMPEFNPLVKRRRITRFRGNL